MCISAWSSTLADWQTFDALIMTYTFLYEYLVSSYLTYLYIITFSCTGVVFPYYSHEGRYHFNFFDAQQVCQDQDATLATFEQLFTAWDEGLDWCNAGWLADGTVQYPITVPRDGCGGADLAPGLRSYGQRHRLLYRYDAFCFSASVKGWYKNV